VPGGGSQSVRSSEAQLRYVQCKGWFTFTMCLSMLLYRRVSTGAAGSGSCAARTIQVEEWTGAGEVHNTYSDPSSLDITPAGKFTDK